MAFHGLSRGEAGRSAREIRKRRIIRRGFPRAGISRSPGAISAGLRRI